MITIYTGTDCTWCHKTKRYLETKGLEYEEKNVSLNDEFKKEMVELTKQLSLPVLIINDKIVLGFDKRQIEVALNE